MSAIASLPPGRRTRAASANTRSLAGERLMTPLEMTASKLASSNGSSSMCASHELDLREAVSVPQPRGLVELLVGDVHPDDAARLADQHRRAEDVGARSRAEVEHRLAGSERGEVEVMADAGERRQRLGGDRVQERGRVAEALGQAPPDLEVELRRLPAGHVAVHVLDLRLQRSPSTSELASSCGRPPLRPSSSGRRLIGPPVSGRCRIHQRAV